MAQKGYEITHLIWDFNGTVLDDVDICIASIDRMLAKRGLPLLQSREVYHSYFRFPVIDYYRAVGLDLEREDYYTVLAPEWIGYYLEAEPRCGLVPGVLPVMQDMRAAGIRQVLLSATRQEQLVAQVSRLGIADQFDELYGNDNIHAASKTHLARAWVDAHPGARPLFVGDTEHDAEVADAVGAPCILYTGGHQSAARLALCGKKMIGDMRELSEAIRS